MNRPEVHEGPQKYRRIRYEKVGIEWVKVGVFSVLGVVPWVIGVVVGVKALGELAGAW